MTLSSAVVLCGWALFTQIMFFLVHPKTKKFSFPVRVHFSSKFFLSVFLFPCILLPRFYMLPWKFNIFSSVYIVPCFEDASLSTLALCFLISGLECPCAAVPEAALKTWPNPTQCDALVIHKHFYWLSFAQGTNVSNCLYLFSLSFTWEGEMQPAWRAS